MSTRFALVLLLALSACRTTSDKRWHLDQTAPQTLRKTAQGEVLGGEGRYGSYAWLGIPYAAPPVGELRWRAPQPALPFVGTFEAKRFGKACPQYASALSGDDPKPGEITGDEDCLTLNVWTPKIDPTKEKLPVMFFIHGGGNSLGTTAIYDGGNLATSQKVIVISTQYRLGPLGWFRHKSLRSSDSDPSGQSGNFGTLDLIAALHWVHDNAASFGGDPGNVTIFGESAGGLNVYSLLLAKPAKGLFHRAIVESGGLWSYTNEEAENWNDQGGNDNSSNELLARLFVTDGKAKTREEAQKTIGSMSDEDVQKYLRSKTPAELLKAHVRTHGFGMLRSPLVFADGTVLPSGNWLDSLARADGWNQVPTIIGTNRDEMKLFLFLDPKRIWKRFWVFPRYVDEQNYQATAEVMSRAWKLAGEDSPAAAMTKSGYPNVYLYRFDWRGEPTKFGSDLSGMLGAAHGLELPFVFGHFDLGRLNIIFPEETKQSREELSAAMMGYWAELARSGNPGKGGAELPEWKSWAPSQSFLALDTKSSGGIRMESGVETPQAIVELVDNDARLPTQKDKCGVFYMLGSWGRGFTKDDYVHAGKKGCADFPYEEWETH
ncbi:MAG: carboxylesterase/lipase family protein [Myxococcaceae bacterium]